MKTIARIENDFTGKFGIPRQSGIENSLVSTVVFEEEFSDPSFIKGIEQYSHLWLIWNFSENENKGYSPTVRPPRLGGNKRVGVFATRSPFRPNPIGLSCVKLLGIEKNNNRTVLKITGADLLSGTPIYDIKPYIPYTDCVKNAVGGFAEEKKNYSLNVIIKDELLKNFPKEKIQALETILSNDPRPSYQNDSDRIYGLSFAGYEVKFKVENDTLYVISISTAI